jgi:hypothetical protein
MLYFQKTLQGLTLEATEAAELAEEEALTADLETETLATEAADVADLLATLARDERDAGSVTPAANPAASEATDEALLLATEAREEAEAEACDTYGAAVLEACPAADDPEAEIVERRSSPAYEAELYFPFKPASSPYPPKGEEPTAPRRRAIASATLSSAM